MTRLIANNKINNI